MIEDRDFSNFLHNTGFGTTRKFKLFTFSLLKGAYEYLPTTHSVIFNNIFYLEISSIVDEFIYQITNHVLKNKKLELNGQKVNLLEYRYINKSITKSKVYIEMISPLTVYQTIKVGEKAKTIYYPPESTMFSQLVNDNFIRKFGSVYKTDQKPFITIKPVKIIKTDLIKSRFKSHIIICYKGIYQLSGQKEYLDFLYNTGIGAKNSMGYGMFKIIDEKHLLS